MENFSFGTLNSGFWFLDSGFWALDAGVRRKQEFSIRYLES